MTEEAKFEAWAIIELFGHQRIAGKISEMQIGGCNFVRVDVPTINGNQGFTKLFGQGAIYGITFVDEAIATAAAVKMRLEPVSVYDLDKLTVNSVRNAMSGQRQLSEDPGWET